VSAHEAKIVAIGRAVKRFGAMPEPVHGKKTILECFTVEMDTVFFWYNSPDCSTRIEKVQIGKN
jgi:hypothetical protein